MDSQGHGSALHNPRAALSSLLNKREKLQNELRSVEKQVYELETSYLQETTTFGNALKGFEGYLSSSKNTSNSKKSRKFQPEDRIFSLSSVTSPAVEELGIAKEDGKLDMIQGRQRSGGMMASTLGKPKRGRSEQREMKRIRLSVGDEDDG